MLRHAQEKRSLPASSSLQIHWPIKCQYDHILVCKNRRLQDYLNHETFHQRNVRFDSFQKSWGSFGGSDITIATFMPLTPHSHKFE